MPSPRTRQTPPAEGANLLPRTCRARSLPMPDRSESTPPPWDESASFRETTLYLLEDPADREAVRHAGRVLHDLALEATSEQQGEESITREELRAAADLRHTGGY